MRESDIGQFRLNGGKNFLDQIRRSAGDEDAGSILSQGGFLRQ
jgi:hypothetical protein